MVTANSNVDNWNDEVIKANVRMALNTPESWEIAKQGLITTFPKSVAKVEAKRDEFIRLQFAAQLKPALVSEPEKNVPNFNERMTEVIDAIIAVSANLEMFKAELTPRKGPGDTKDRTRTVEVKVGTGTLVFQHKQPVI